jgi:chemotaxis protein CheD
MSLAWVMRNAQSRLKVVGIAEMYVSGDPEDILVTYSLGSCVGVSLYDTEARVGGLIHCMLPSSAGEAKKAEEKPCMYVDTGMTKLLQALLEMGAEKKRLICKVAGGGSPLDDNGLFKIGERNYGVLRKFLWKNGLLVKAEDVGGKGPRTMLLDIETGITRLRINHDEEREL